MDIYRFFHPFHNPRLHSTPVRQQELSEIEHAASELRKVLTRLQQRTQRTPVGPILPKHFESLIEAMDFVERSVQTLSDAHPGDTQEDLLDLIAERSASNGWEAWCGLLGEQLSSETVLNSANTGHHSKDLDSDSSDSGDSNSDEIGRRAA